MLEPYFRNVFNLSNGDKVIQGLNFEVFTFDLSLFAEHFALLSQLIMLKNLLVDFFKLLFLGIVELHFL